MTFDASPLKNGSASQSPPPSPDRSMTWSGPMSEMEASTPANSALWFCPEPAPGQPFFVILDEFGYYAPNLIPPPPLVAASIGAPGTSPTPILTGSPGGAGESCEGGGGQ